MQPQLFLETGNSDELKKYLPVNVNTSFRTLAPYFAQVEENYIKPLLGNELYNELARLYQAKELTPEYEQLLDYCRFAEINLCYFLGFDILSISLSDGGISTKATEGTRTFRYQEENAKRAFKNNGFNMLDSILNFVYETPDLLILFESSLFYKEAKKTLIPDTKMFNSIYNINNSRLVFLKMKQYIQLVEDIELRHFFGDAFVDELLNADLESEKYNTVATYIRHYIVYMSIEKGISELKKIPTEKGLIFESITLFPTDGYNQIPVESKEVKETKSFCKQTAENYLSSAIHYLKKHKDEFPEYIAFAGENSPLTVIAFRKNNGKKTFFFPVKS